MTCTATAAADNSAAGSFTVTVRGAADQAMDLVSLLKGYDGCGCAVQAAQAHASLERASRPRPGVQLGAVRNSTAATLRSGRLTASQSNAVNNAVARILATIG